jgi:transcriptional antiterminator RfaH
MTAAARTLAEPATLADPSRWYIIATQSKQERSAAYHLRRLVNEVYLPMRAFKIVAPTKHSGSMPLFPRYLFVRVDPKVAEWWAIRSAIGVKALISTGDHPAALPPGFVEAIKRHEVDGLVSLRKLQAKAEDGPEVKVGDHVKIEVGEVLFAAVIEEKIDANRVRLLLQGVGGSKPMRVIARRAQLQS